MHFSHRQADQCHSAIAVLVPFSISLRMFPFVNLFMVRVKVIGHKKADYFAVRLWKTATRRQSILPLFALPRT